MVPVLLDIITTAAILYIVSSGLLLVFGVMKLINFAHGGLLTIGGYAAVIATALGLNPWIGIPLAAVFGGIVGFGMERVVVRSLYNRPLDAILATWGLSIIIGQAITLVFDRGVHFAEPPIRGVISILGEPYSTYRLVLTALALLLGLGLTAALRGTSLGLSTRAVIMNEDLARGLGINSGLVRSITFTLGSGLAAVAGALITPLSSVDPNMGVAWLISAFMLVLVSGSSLYSLAFASVVLGGAQVIVSNYFGSVLGGMTIAALAAVILRIRPQGFSYE
ncbi:branched-chain amino acid ABC transporter permease [Mesorhizobium sp. CA8]|uniref:branched-chain amino acid ABC transporter permease n=1 Tax=unclassified Mesorhizobium TaxID=325217 RepID=UPI001CCE1B75|nr:MULTISPECIES: branched-chain amino acid ABC transporter permease [unclassified Mesorhizobium]MBZ9765031.1 branched-chain amino acid ABC transporter permease [Mesorhizobium sp. CA8]MBZ9823514.1 branched-chain amino acid ABC transporter permease [Mesorhizobium sp. CA4]